MTEEQAHKLKTASDRLREAFFKEMAFQSMSFPVSNDPVADKEEYAFRCLMAAIKALDKTLYSVCSPAAASTQKSA